MPTSCWTLAVLPAAPLRYSSRNLAWLTTATAGSVYALIGPTQNPGWIFEGHSSPPLVQTRGLRRLPGHLAASARAQIWTCARSPTCHERIPRYDSADCSQNLSIAAPTVCNCSFIAFLPAILFSTQLR